MSSTRGVGTGLVTRCDVRVVSEMVSSCNFSLAQEGGREDRRQLPHVCWGRQRVLGTTSSTTTIAYVVRTSTTILSRFHLVQYDRVCFCHIRTGYFLTWLCVVWMVTDEVSWTDRMVRPVRFEENRLPDGKSNFAAYSFDNRSKDLYELGNVFLFLPPTQKRNIHSFSWLKFFRKNWIGHISIVNYTALVTCIMCKCLNVVLYMMLCMKKICASNSTCEA